MCAQNGCSGMLLGHLGARNGCSGMLRSQLGAQNHCSSMLRSHQGARNGCSGMLRSQLGAQNHCSSMLRSHSGAQNLAQACLGATWALRMTARACFASTVLSKAQFNIASKPLRIRNLCSNPASKMLYVRKLRSHSALEITVRTLVRRPCTFESSNALVSVSLISVALDSAPL